GRLAELVCSNSFKSLELENAHGLLKAELRRMGSLLLTCAEEARVPGGAALAVDREVFSELVHARVTAHPRIRVATGEVTALPSPGVVATGPLTSDALAAAIAARSTRRSSRRWARRTSSAATTSTRCPTSRAASRWRRWRSAGRRRSASAR